MDHGVNVPIVALIHNEKPEAELQEIYEYWFEKFTPNLGERLREKGEPWLLLSVRAVGYEGRTCTGQMISLDDVISAICYETRMENIAE